MKNIDEDTNFPLIVPFFALFFAPFASILTILPPDRLVGFGVTPPTAQKCQGEPYAKAAYQMIQIACPGSILVQIIDACSGEIMAQMPERGL